MKKIIFSAAAVIFFLSSFAQIKDLANKFLKNKPDPIADLLKGREPMTTSFFDVDTGCALSPNFGNGSVYKSITMLPRTANGGFMLNPGFYEYQAQSYCLHAGTYGPGSGNGYMFAPPKGPKAEIIISIVQNSVKHPEIEQRDIQLLLWAIITKAKFKDLQNNIKLVATQLLTPQQILELDGGVVGVIPDDVLQKGIASLPQAVQQVMRAENDLRRKLTTANATYEEMERTAVLAGLAPDQATTKFTSGTWSLHPDCYLVRYIPSGYNSTKVQICVPPSLHFFTGDNLELLTKVLDACSLCNRYWIFGDASPEIEFDPAKHVVVPANTSWQRLIISGRIKQENK